MSYDLPLEAIKLARARIAPYMRHTPLVPPPMLYPDLPPQLQLKLENLQVSGSFKARGAFNTLLQLDPEQRKRGVIAASAGNHGVGVGYAAWRLGVPATVYLPATANPDRVARIAAWEVQVILYGETWDDAHAKALEHAAAEGKMYVHPFDAEHTVAGQGTLGLELLDDVPELDCVLVAIGGGGLIAGVAAAIKQCRPTVRIIGVEPIGAASMWRSVEQGRLVELPEVHTIADTLATRSVGERTLALVQRYVDEIVLVEDLALVTAMRRLWLEYNQLVEPSGAATLAALLNSAVSVERYAHPVALICGGNAAAESVFGMYQQAADITTSAVNQAAPVLT